MIPLFPVKIPNKVIGAYPGPLLGLPICPVDCPDPELPLLLVSGGKVEEVDPPPVADGVSVAAHDAAVGAFVLWSVI